MSVGVERVDDDGAIHLDRLIFVITVEEYSTSVTAHRRLSLLMHHGIGPERDDLLGWFQFFRIILPRHTGRSQIELTATAQQQRQQRCQSQHRRPMSSG